MSVAETLNVIELPPASAEVVAIAGALKSVDVVGPYRTLTPTLSNKRCRPVPSEVEPRNWPGTRTRPWARPYGAVEFEIEAMLAGHAAFPPVTSGDEAERSIVGVFRTGLTFSTSCEVRAVIRTPRAVRFGATTDWLVAGWIGSYWVTWGSRVVLPGPFTTQKLPRPVMSFLVKVEPTVRGIDWSPAIDGSGPIGPGGGGASGGGGGVLPVGAAPTYQNGRP